MKGYRFLGGAISFYSVSCTSDVVFNPSILNWSSLILTVAHMYCVVSRKARTNHNQTHGQKVIYTFALNHTSYSVPLNVFRQSARCIWYKLHGLRKLESSGEARIY